MGPHSYVAPRPRVGPVPEGWQLWVEEPEPEPIQVEEATIEPLIPEEPTAEAAPAEQVAEPVVAEQPAEVAAPLTVEDVDLEQLAAELEGEQVVEVPEVAAPQAEAPRVEAQQ